MIVFVALFFILALCLLTTSVLSFTTHGSTRRRARKLVWIFTCGITVWATLIFVLVRLMIGLPPPTMKELARNFPARRAALDQIVALSTQDDSYQFVDRYHSEQCLALDPAGYPYHGQHDEKRLPQSRLNQYFALYRQADVRDGLIRSRAGDVDLIAGVGNDLYGGHTTGYLYCEQAPVPDLSPERRDEACTGNHNDPSRSAKFYRYQKLADHWFAYERGSK